MFRRRAAVKGFRLALLCHGLYPTVGKKERGVIIDFVKWFCSVDLYNSLYQFGERYNDLQEKTVAKKIPHNKVFDRLGETFSKNDVRIMLQKIGRKTPVKVVLSLWNTNGLIEKKGEGYVKIKKGHIYFGIAISLLIAAYFGGFIRDVVSQSSVANEWARSYIQEGSEKAWSNNLSNPMIWYQILILWLFTYYEQFFAKLSKHYYTIRNAYFYSTVLLIVLCQYGILAGRTSTVFATYECMMIPMFLLLFKKWRISGLAHIVVAVLYAGLLYYNIYRFVY